MVVHAYWAYGLRIHAELDCPELPVHPEASGEPDVTIRLLPPVASITESLENRFYEVRPGIFRMAISGVANYLVEEGRRISVEPLVGAQPEEVRLYLLGSSMGAVLYQRGLFPLHGSTVETRWGAMIFVGTQGIGKSTLAAHFHRKGYRVLSDDVCAIAAEAEQLRVLPALSHFRLCGDAYERLGTASEGLFHVDKFVVPMREGYCPDPVKLKAIHVLVDQEDGTPKFELIHGFDRVLRLFENLYRPEYLQGQTTQGDLMRMAGVIAQKSAMVVVSRRRDVETIEEMVGFLESSWVKHFGPSPAEERN